MNFSPRYVGLLIRIQWIDRSATSTFIVGITAQTFILASSIAYMTGASDAVPLQAALRSHLLVGLALCSLSAMSAFQNEFRFQTVWQTARDPRQLKTLMLVRALAMVIITAPALCVPFVVASLVVGKPPTPFVASIMFLLVTLVLIAYTHILTLFLAVTYDPARVVPWVRIGTMTVLVGTVPVVSPIIIRLIFPFYWIEQIANGDLVAPTLLAIGTTVIWWVGGLIVLRRPSSNVLDHRLTDNVEAR